MTDDEADFELLSLAGDKRRFVIEVNDPLAPAMQSALERAMDREWITLIDLSGAPAAPNRLMRIFRLTDAGMDRLAQLRVFLGVPE